MEQTIQSKMSNAHDKIENSAREGKNSDYPPYTMTGGCVWFFFNGILNHHITKVSTILHYHLKQHFVRVNPIIALQIRFFFFSIWILGIRPMITKEKNSKQRAIRRGDNGFSVALKPTIYSFCVNIKLQVNFDME